MSFFKTEKSIEAVKDNNFEYIQTSGIYPVTINTIAVNKNQHGAISLNFYCNYKGSDVVFYGLKLDNNDGSRNFQWNIFNSLCVIADLDNIDNPTELSIKDPITKKDMTIQALTEFSGLNVYIKINLQYEMYNGEIKEKRIIDKFYREDKATASEIINNVKTGVQYDKDLGYADRIIYKDGLTAEDIAEWKADKKSTTATKEPKVVDNPFSK